MSVRVGMSYNGANIYAYQYQNLNSDGTPIAGGRSDGGRPRPARAATAICITHFQLDAQATMRVARGLSVVVYGLNLNNEVFGFYNGSPQYVVQREFYKPTFAIGFRLHTAVAVAAVTLNGS